MFSVVTPSKMPNTTKTSTAKYAMFWIFQNERMQKLIVGTIALFSWDNEVISYNEAM